MPPLSEFELIRRFFTHDTPGTTLGVGDEFRYVHLPEAFTTGSSLMPQKRNPDGLELARGMAARSIGDLTSALAMLKGTPSGYNKDFQEDKRLLFGAVDAMEIGVGSGARARLWLDQFQAFGIGRRPDVAQVLQDGERIVLEQRRESPVALPGVDAYDALRVALRAP